MARYAVIGLGEFGTSVASYLTREGEEVMAIDKDLERAESLEPEVDSAVSLDSCNEDSLRGIEVESFDCVVVAIGAGHMKESILTTTLLRQIGVPKVVARASNELHARVLRAVGAHEVLDPLAEMGQRLARRLANPDLLEELEFGEASVAELSARPDFYDKSLSELNVRGDYQVNVLAIRSESSGFNAAPDGRDVIEEGDTLIVMGSPDNVRAFAKGDTE